MQELILRFLYGHCSKYDSQLLRFRLKLISRRRSLGIIVPQVFLVLDRRSAKWPFRGARQRLEGVASPAFLRQLRLAMIP